MATGIAAILGTWNARGVTGVGLLVVDYFLVPLAQVLLTIACMILLQAPREFPRWWWFPIGFAGASVGIEIARDATTTMVLGGLAMQGLFLVIAVLLAWLADREKISVETASSTARGIIIFGGLLYGAFATTWVPPLSIYLLFIMLLASWSVRTSIRQWQQLRASSPAMRNSFFRLTFLALAITAALILFSMLAVPSSRLFLYPAIAAWAIIALDTVIMTRPATMMPVLVKAMDVLIAVEFLAILLGSA